MRFELPSHEASAAVEIALEPPPQVVDRSSTDPARQQEIKVFFTKRNRIALHDVVVRKVEDLVDPGTAAEFQARWSGRVEYRVVCIRLGCLPDPDCQFTWVRADFQLGSNVEPSNRPLICSLSPETTSDIVDQVRSLELSAKLEVKALGTTANSLGGSDKTTVTAKSKRYRIAVIGKMSPNPAWDFRATESDPEIIGDITLIMVAAMKAGISARGFLSLSATARLRSGFNDIPLVTKRTQEGVVRHEFQL
jgi:hypothetical protein